MKEIYNYEGVGELTLDKKQLEVFFKLEAEISNKNEEIRKIEDKYSETLKELSDDLKSKLKKKENLR